MAVVFLLGPIKSLRIVSDGGTKPDLLLSGSLRGLIFWAEGLNLELKFRNADTNPAPHSTFMEHSFGIIPLRFIKKRWTTLLVKHVAGHWAFPKGHPRTGETPQQTATRELFEETHLKIKKFLSIEPLSEYYRYNAQEISIEKQVLYYPAQVEEGGIVLQEEELTDFCWLSINKAFMLATFPETKKLLSQILKFLQNNPCNPLEQVE